MKLKNNDFKNILLERRSVKEFDINVKIPNEEILEILNATVTAPSSVNFQPWRFAVVNSDEGKEKLRPLVAFNTRQNDTSAAMIVIFGDKTPQQYGEEIYSMAVKKGYMPKEIKEKILPNFQSFYENFSEQQINDVIKIDASLAAMQLMLVARAYGYETNAIGGFDSKNIAEVLGYDKNRYVPVMIIAIGKGIKEGRKTYRMPAEKLTTFI